MRSVAQCGHAIALANGMVALDLALHGLGIGWADGGVEHDEVIITPRTFIAKVSTKADAGAVPVCADVDRDSGNLSAATIDPVLTDRARAIIVVHLGGWPVDMDPIMALAKARGITPWPNLLARKFNKYVQGRFSFRDTS